MRLFTLALLLAAGLVPARAQTPYTFTGSVLDARVEEGIPGANVVLSGTSYGASTALDGSFSFQAPVEAGTYTVEARFVGYQTARREVTLGSERTIDLGVIELREDVLRGSEIVVTGSGVPTERRQLGNTIASVSAADLADLGAAAIDQALAGKVAGALIQQNSGDPAGGISIRLRGPSSVVGSADPLYIVDGVIVDNSSAELIDLGGNAQNRLADLNPEDIERIEVVKGAAAAALYGSRANNGVVQIFTKRGTTGEPRITLSTGVRTDAVRQTLDVNLAQNADGDFIGNDGSPTDADGNAVQRFDYQDDIFRRAAGTEQYASVAGGRDATTYFVSGGHFLNQGVVEGSRFRRINGRARLTQRFGELANLSVGANYTNSLSNDVPNGGLNSNYGALTGFIFGPNTVDPAPDPETGEYTSGILANPLEVVNVYDFEQNTNRFIGDVQLGLTPFDNFSVDYTLGLDTYEQVATAFIPPGTGLTPQGFSRRAERSVQFINQDLRARYRAEIRPGLASTTIAGFSGQYEDVNTFAVSTEDLGLGVETVSGGASPSAPGEFRSERTILGIFGQQTFGIGDRLFLTGALRTDASSAFGEDDRWNTYAKVSASYDLAREAFWADGSLGDVLPNFRLRLSYGETGGITAIGAYDRFTNYGAISYAGQPGLITPGTRGSIDIRPERQREFEIGLDVGALGGRLGLEATYYNQETDDLLLGALLAPSTGFSSQFTNIGVLTNNGFELVLRALPISTNAFEWSSSISFATNRNEVSGIEGDVFVQPESFGIVAAINDEPLGVFFTTRTFERNDAGEIVGQPYDFEAEAPAVDADGNAVLVPASLNDDGYLVDADGNVVLPVRGDEARIIGDPNPDWTGSWINEFDLGGQFSFRFQFDATVGFDVFNFTRRLAALSVFGTLEDFERELEGDLPPGYNGRAFGIFEHWIEDGTYVKLREVAFTWNVPARYVAPARLRGLRVTAYGRNLLSFDDYSGYDPETNVGGQRTAVRGYDFVQVPIPRTFGLKLTATL